ncbi:hypothetical protein MMI38_004789 [Escherichia coli]|nr:hypothetical protein [Escherichia coli]
MDQVTAKVVVAPAFEHTRKGFGGVAVADCAFRQMLRAFHGQQLHRGGQ